MTVPNTRHVPCLDAAAGFGDESCPADATDDDCDVTLAAAVDELNRDSNQISLHKQRDHPTAER